VKVAGVNIKPLKFGEATPTKLKFKSAGLGVPTTGKSDSYAKDAKRRIDKWASKVAG